MKNRKAAVIIAIVSIIGSAVFMLLGNNISFKGMLTVFPILMVVLLAFLTDNVVFSIAIGLVDGLFILSSGNIAVLPENTFSVIENVLFDLDNLKIVILCLMIGGLVEAIRKINGFEAFADLIIKKIRTPRMAQLVCALLGCAIFFDDYANALVVGPVMKPVSDKVGMSREKLAYIVDSTSAPVTGISIVSSWVAVEIGAIEKGLKAINVKGSGFSLFLKSVPFCFYCLFCLTFVFINAFIGRDFGPMLKAETAARKKKETNDIDKEEISEETTRAFIGIIAIILLVVLALIFFYITGRKAGGTNVLSSISLADTSLSIILASFLSTLFVAVHGYIHKFFYLKGIVLGWLSGMKKMSGTIVPLLLAWGLAEVVAKLGTASYLANVLSYSVPVLVVPLLIFICCCIISFVSGSYGCLFLIMPLSVELAYRMMPLVSGITGSEFVIICIASVMAGSIFGDHCSPVTDCTILSSMGSGCETMDHVRTQMPYATFVAVISCTGILCSCIGLSLPLILIGGIAAQILWFYVIGENPDKD